MSVAVTTSDLQRAAVILREALKDRSYRATPLGLEVARYYRWKKNEWGATAATMRDYEGILARLALYHADLELRDLAPPVGTERLRECWDHYWGETSGRTRAKVRSVWVDFFEWAVRERELQGNPARPLKAPKKRDVHIETFTPSFVDRVIGSQVYPADWIGVTLILRYGIRRGGIMNIRRKHFDLERRELMVFTKGGRIYPVPIPDSTFWRKLGELELEAQWRPEDFLLYHRDTRNLRMGLDEDWTQADEILTLGKGKKAAYRRETRRNHAKTPSGTLVHKWWYRCLEQAGMVAAGTTGGMNMHRGRHTAATELQRSKHDLRLTQRLLGHVDISSTARYAQLDTGDLADAMAEVYPQDEE